MDKIRVESNPSPERLKELKVETWSPWSCEVSEFDWEYSETESCYFLEGEVIVEAKGQRVQIKKGDLAFFPKGLTCVWKVLKPVRKVYKFG